jgi:hypothetical protein
VSRGEASQRLQRRSRRRRLLFWLLAIGAIAAAVLLIRCGGGFGLGKGGLGVGGGSARGLRAPTGSGSASAAAPARCAVRVDGSGITLGGTAAAVGEVVTACRASGGADVVVAGDARQGTWDELRAALDGAGVAVHVRGAGAAPETAVDAGVLDGP